MMQCVGVVLVAALTLAQNTSAQTIAGDSEPFRIGTSQRGSTSQFQEQVVTAPIAQLRGLDKLTGIARDIEANVGEPLQFGYVDVLVDECRYPRDNPTGNAYAHLTIRDRRNADAPMFEGWMIAASPALNALDHPRYDVWVKRCQLASERLAPDAPEGSETDPAVPAGVRSPRPIMRP